MSAQELRDRFVAFFRERGHTVVPAAPLVPSHDPSLLFNSAGMVQFKGHYASADPLPYRRAVSVQPCFRAGGKDSDIENVGRTPRHLSFFEMLGNFSFGDYFKEQAVVWAWELLVDVYGIDGERLWVSVFEDDEEAAKIWEKRVGIPRARIVPLGRADNFWGPAGQTGACGPCSEVYFDRGPSHGGERPGDDGDRFFELYNLVFPQFDMQENGTLAPLRNRGIDTGMGLERLALVVSGGETVFDTDLFRPIIEEASEITGVEYGRASEDERRALRVIADHVRGLTFAIAENVLPSNEGRGYVLRRILRRAARRGFALGLTEPFLDRLSGVVIDQYHEQYAALGAARERVALALRSEEERFQSTLGAGMGRFLDAVKRAKDADRETLSGEEVFALYDTYGFPTDLVSEMATEHGLSIDEPGFERAMAEQKNRSRKASRFDETHAPPALETVGEGAHSTFLGYEALESDVRIRKLGADGRGALVVLDQTPFYAEAGGQVGDTGTIRFPSATLRVLDTRREGDTIVHVVAKPEGVDLAALTRDVGRAAVHAERRGAIQRNHTATHLLHAALRRVLGTHVAQAGSLVAPDRLRFDFTHFQPMTPEEIAAVEEQVAADVLSCTEVATEETSLADALAAGAMALFGEKYADRVRQVIVGEASRELCGGTHVSVTGEIGAFAILSEAGVAAGTRRVEAVTGLEAARVVRRERDALGRLASRLHAARGEVESKLDALLTERQSLARALEAEREARQKHEIGGAMDEGEQIGDVLLLVRRIEAESAGAMRKAADMIRKRMQSGVAILGAETGGKASFLVFVTKDLASAGRFRADEIVRAMAEVAGGSGGGKPDLALAGGKDAAKIDDALERGRELVRAAANGERSNA